MAELKSDPMAETKSETPPVEKFYTARLATDAQGNHGYEIGYFPLNADLNDPSLFVVVDKIYAQVEAFTRANVLNCTLPISDPMAPEPHAQDEDEDDEDMRAAKARREHHGPVRHRPPAR